MRATMFCACLLLATAAEAQWAKQRDPRVPVSRNGTPNLDAPAPRAAGGKPDLSGVWKTDGGPLPEFIPTVEGAYLQGSKHMIDVTADMKPGTLQMEPWAEALLKERMQDPTLHPAGYCKPTGEPASAEVPLPFKIVQTPRLVLVLYEENAEFRQIFLDGRKVVPDAQPTYYGYSNGRWEGDTLVVETSGFNDKTFLDFMGHPHTEAMRMTERFRRLSMGKLEVVITITDPKAYRTPIVYTRRASLMPEDELMEYFCTENEKDAVHYQK